MTFSAAGHTTFPGRTTLPGQDNDVSQFQTVNRASQIHSGVAVRQEAAWARLSSELRQRTAGTLERLGSGDETDASYLEICADERGDTQDRSDRAYEGPCA
jgi:hypothetical protein